MLPSKHISSIIIIVVLYVSPFPSARHILNIFLDCIEDMVRRFEPGHGSKLANFADGGRMVISCSDGEIGVVLVATATSEILCCEEFKNLKEGRNKPAYSISHDGKRVRDEQLHILAFG